MEVDETHPVPKSLNPYVKLYKMNMDVHKTLKDQLRKADDVELENQSNRLIEDTQTLRVLLKRITVYECKQCYYCYTTERDYKLHKLKHAAPVVRTEFSYDKYNNYVKKFQCEDCDLRFVAESTLEAHSAVHLPFPHVCHCGIGYHRREDLAAHKQLVHPEIEQENVWQPKTSYMGKTIKSEFCLKSEYVAPVSNAIKTKLGVYKPKNPKKAKSKIKNESANKKGIHIGVKIPDVECEKIEIDGKMRYVCLTCHKDCSSYRALQFHNFGHTGEKPYECDVCGTRFTQSGNFKIHRAVHDGVTFECSVCKKLFSRKHAMDLHMRIHTGEKPYKCDFCGKDFSDPSAFARHIRTHTGDKRYQCQECPMRFSDASGLIVHKLRHTGIRKYQCDICQKKFFLNTDMKKHVVRVHAKLYMCECDYCGKQFTSKEYLKSHMKWAGIHSGLKCEFCPRVFFHENQRMNHLKVHKRLEYDDYNCDFCGESFDGKASIAKHLKMEHNL